MTRAVRRAASGLLAILVAGSPLAAQSAPVVDAGLAIVRFPEEDRWIVGPWLRAAVQRDALAVRARGVATLIASPGGPSGSVEGAAAWRGRVGAGALAWEAGGEAAALYGSVSRPSESMLAMVRLLYPIGPAGLWLRPTAHVAWRESGALHGAGLEGGAWWRLARASLTATVSRQAAEGQLFFDDRPGRPVAVVPVRYTQGALGLSTEVAWGTLDASVGARYDRDAAERVEAAWSAGVLLRASERIGITLDVARQPADFVRGADAMRSASVGLRFTGPTARVPRPARPGAVVELVGTAGSAPRTLRIRAAGARSVEVMGSFTDWEPVALTGSAGEFLLALPLAPGAHRLLLRTDGGPWRVPANTPAVDDDLGGRVGLMVVP
jgi:hypothetical protein